MVRTYIHVHVVAINPLVDIYWTLMCDSSRCTVPNIDVATGKKSPFGEPLQTLRRHRALVDE